MPAIAGSNIFLLISNANSATNNTNNDTMNVTKNDTTEDTTDDIIDERFGSCLMMRIAFVLESINIFVLGVGTIFRSV